MDWQKMRSEYINGNASYREIAEAFGVSEGAVRQHGAREKWVEAREKQKRRAQALADEETAQKRAADLSDVDAMRKDLRVEIYKELSRRMSAAGNMDGADFRRLVQSFLDMRKFDIDDGSGEGNELLQSLYELLQRRNNEQDY